LQKKKKQTNKQKNNDNKNVDKFGVLTPNTLKSTTLKAISPTLVTWVEEKRLRESNIAPSTYQYLQPGLLSS
jgi:hypothetical protein